MEKNRYTSALIGIPLVILIFLIGNKYIVDISMSIISMIAMNEYFNAISKVAMPVKWIGYVSCLSIAVLHIIPNEILMQALLFAVPAILLILFLHVILTEMRITVKDIAYTFFGICYVVFFMMFIALIAGRDNGKILVWFTIISAWVTDIFAYFVGKTIGKHKFSKISPKKSIEGCIGGTFFAVIILLGYMFISNTYWGTNYSYINVTWIGLLLSLIGQIGDFSASCIKRYVDIKDYSNLIPGHGGILDRMDSFLFIAPFAYLLFGIM
ncbi:MAG: phosphatidate cytidylyltransferase [Clostridia bacterium]|nr:phosphatidate cytidylyltransferase [Clostridia bacterium]